MIKEIEKNGKLVFLVRVMARSKERPNIRVDMERTVDTKKEAEKTEKKLWVEAIRKLREREGRAISWGDLVGKWEMALRYGQGFLKRPLGRSTASDYVQALHLYTGDWWKRPADQIGGSEVEEVLVAMKAEGRSNSRMRQILNAVNGAYKYGQKMGFIRRDIPLPTNDIAPINPRFGEKKPEILNITEIRKLLSAAREVDHPWYPHWSMALLTGMRSGELYALEWKDVDLVTKRLTVNNTYNRRYREIKPTKGGYWRDVPINCELERLLKDLRTASPTSTHVLPRFSDWERGESARVLRAFCKGIGVPSVKFHTLRACFATQLLKDGVAAAVVMKICGWKELDTMQYYVRLAGVEIDGATKVLEVMPLDEAMGRVVPLYRGKK